MTWLFQNTGCEALLNQKLAQERSVLLGRDTKESNKLHKAWRRSRFCKDVDKLLSGQQITSPDVAHEDSDSESDDLSLHNHLPSLAPQEDARPSGSVQPPFIPARKVPLDAFSPHDTDTTTTMSLPPNSWRLLDIYFAFTQSWLPICERPDTLKLSYSYPEIGLVLSSAMPNSGDHAELWSILAVASHQSRPECPETAVATESESLYSVARSLIPDERGLLGVGHVKAMVNLAIVQLGRANFEAAWLLVGSASRTLLALEQSPQPVGSRWKHLLGACFLLDNLLSSQLHRRRYLEVFDLRRFGPIEEDGLEEWQPWSSPLHPSLSHGSRTPLLSLSSFNRLLEITDMLSSSEQPADTGLPSEQVLGQLNSWKASLPPTLEYIRDERKHTPLNPPAVLLQLSHLYTCFALSPSQPVLTQILDLLERYSDQFGVAALPPVSHCFLQSLQRSSMYLALEATLQFRLESIRLGISSTWSSTSREALGATPVPTNAQARPSVVENPIPTPESLQVPFDSPYAPARNQSGINHRPRGTSSLLNDLLPDMNTTITNQRSEDPRTPNFDPLRRDFFSPSLYQHKSTTSRDIESFFDELASLDGAEIVDNQPQFMQNLGFAPDASMADFLAADLSQYLPMASTTFMPQGNNGPTQLDPALFDAG